jgi:hypothetical protein
LVDEKNDVEISNPVTTDSGTAGKNLKTIADTFPFPYYHPEKRMVSGTIH